MDGLVVVVVVGLYMKLSVATLRVQTDYLNMTSATATEA